MNDAPYQELIHCWFSERQHGDDENFTWFKMDNGEVRKVSDTHVEAHGNAEFLMNFPDAEYVGVGHFSHIGPTATPE